jgi:hypothetical protein
VYEHCLEEAKRFLSTYPDVVISAKALWLEVRKTCKTADVDLPQLTDFTMLLEGDKRFEFIEPRRNTSSNNGKKDGEFDDPGEEEHRASVGISPSSLVKLRGVALPERMEDLLEASGETSDDILSLDAVEEEVENADSWEEAGRKFHGSVEKTPVLDRREDESKSQATKKVLPKAATKSTVKHAPVRKQPKKKSQIQRKNVNKKRIPRSKKRK